MYKYKKIKREYQRQENVLQGWKILNSIVLTMSSSKIKQNILLLDNFEGNLKQELRQNGIKKHKAMDIFKQYSTYMKNKKHFEHGIISMYCITLKYIKN